MHTLFPHVKSVDGHVFERGSEKGKWSYSLFYFIIFMYSCAFVFMQYSRHMGPLSVASSLLSPQSLAPSQTHFFVIQRLLVHVNSLVGLQVRRAEGKWKLVSRCCPFWLRSRIWCLWCGRKLNQAASRAKNFTSMHCTSSFTCFWVFNNLHPVSWLLICACV